MNAGTSIAELKRLGVLFRAEEAVAVAQQLIDATRQAAAADESAGAPFGPPPLENVFVDSDGRVTCSACESTLVVSEVAIFLQSLLPAGGNSVHGSLRYAIARALLEVDAPPFDSVDEFSGVLRRFERGDRQDVLRGMIHRAFPARRLVGSSAVSSYETTHEGRRDADETAPAVERRRTEPRVAELRRDLHEADRRAYDLQRAVDALVAMAPAAPSKRSRRLAIVAGVAFGLAFAAGATLLRVSGRAEPVTRAVPPAPPAPHPTPLKSATADAPVHAVAPAASSPAPRREQIRPASRPVREPAVRRAKPDAAPARERAQKPSSRLRWLRGKIAIRTDPL